MSQQHIDRVRVTREAVICCAILLSLTTIALAQTTSSEKLETSARHFVQSFYDWYAPVAVSENKEPAWKIAIAKRNSFFDPHLRQALELDLAAQAKSPGQIVGLDFDPFLNSQDPDKKYKAAKVSAHGGRVLVDVYAVQRNTADKPAVIAEIEERSGSWVFVNFLYPDNGDLLAVLSRLRKYRDVPSK